MIIIPKKAVRFPIQSSLNRASTYTFFCNYSSINFTVTYHRRTTAMGLHINEAPLYLNNNGIYMIVFRDLKKSEFAENCLDLDYTENETLDYRGKFISIKNKFKSNIYQYFGEKLEFDTLKSDNGTEDSRNENYLSVMGFKIEGSRSDFIYLMFQRRCFSQKNNKDVCRNLCLQFHTRRGEKLFHNLITGHKESGS